MKLKMKRTKVVGFEVLTAVVMKSSIFWDVSPCSPLKVNRRFGEHVASIFRVSSGSCLAYSSTLKVEATCSSETSTINGLHGVIPQKTELFRIKVVLQFGMHDL
jgi:hypothetical protein